MMELKDISAPPRGLMLVGADWFRLTDDERNSLEVLYRAAQAQRPRSPLSRFEVMTLDSFGSARRFVAMKAECREASDG